MKLNGGYNGLCGRYFRRALFAVFLILSGCAGERQEGAVHKIQVNIDSLAKEQVSIYDIFSKVELVSLDNEYPVGNIVYTGASNITWDGSRFYILDVRTFGINVYGADGTLLKIRTRSAAAPESSPWRTRFTTTRIWTLSRYSTLWAGYSGTPQTH